jgi:SAM-dependent methyltransferase
MEMAMSLDDARYARMRWNTPLSLPHAELLLDRLAVPRGGSVLDLGCGWGELLLQAVASGAASGIGVDTDTRALERGRQLAVSRGLHERVEFVAGAAAGWPTPADRVLCIGASHAWGGTREALAQLATLVRPGGRLLFGDGCWQQPPSDAAAALFGDDVVPMAGLAQDAVAAGWRILHLSTADQREWDDFESTWRAGREEWLLANRSDPRAATMRAELDSRLTEYLTLYRGTLGFCYLVLAR